VLTWADLVLHKAVPSVVDGMLLLGGGSGVSAEHLLLSNKRSRFCCRDLKPFFRRLKFRVLQ
jgi:hypothetical protein